MMKVKRIWTDIQAVEKQRRENERICQNLNRIRQSLNALEIDVTDTELAEFWHDDKSLIERVTRDKETEYDRFYKTLPFESRPTFNATKIAGLIHKIFADRKKGLDPLFRVFPCFRVEDGKPSLSPDFDKVMTDKYSVDIEEDTPKWKLYQAMQKAMDAVGEIEDLLTRYWPNKRPAPISNTETSLLSVKPNIAAIKDKNLLSPHYWVLKMLEDK